MTLRQSVDFTLANAASLMAIPAAMPPGADADIETVYVPGAAYVCRIYDTTADAVVAIVP